MKREFTSYQRRDWVIAGVLVVIAALIVGARLSPGMVNWGDDFAAYLSEGIAISQGRFDEQVELNGRMYMAELPQKTREKGLVYVWGFPLLLALVHRLVGFDLVNYSSIIFYKMPSLIAFACLAGILYLFYRRFFSRGTAVFLTLLLCVNTNFSYTIDVLNSDVVFLFAAMLSFLLAECFFDLPKERLEKPCGILLAAFLGVSLWFTYETRLNGSTVVLIVLLGHGIRLIRERKSLSLTVLLRQLIPYGVFLVLKLVSEGLLAPASSNMGDVGKASADMMLSNIQYYYVLTTDFLKGLSGQSWVYRLFCICLAVGLVTAAWRWNNLPYFLLTAGTYAVLVLLPYTQGLRYLYGALPLLLLFAGHGWEKTLQWLMRLIPRKGTLAVKGLLVAAAAAVLLNIYVPAVKESLSLARNGIPLDEADVYSAEAVDMYRYIRENTREEDTIMFIKTRALYLNTERLSVYPGLNGNTMADVDYFLFSWDAYIDYDLLMKEWLDAEDALVYENGVFYLYRLGE